VNKNDFKFVFNQPSELVHCESCILCIFVA